MYEARIDEDIREFGYRLQSQGLNIENYMKYTGLDKDSFRKQFQAQSERQVKLRLALEAIAAKDNIQPSEEDLEKEYAKIAEGYKMEADKVKQLIRREDLEKDISVEKAFDLVRDSAVIAEMD